MIDFRYHLVSLVAVFIALAVGIVLGAGPLRDGISETLDEEVAQLRTERTELRAQLDAVGVRAAAKDEALDLLGGRAVAGTLTGARVGVVMLPGADRNQVARVEDRVDEAGGSLVFRGELDSNWEQADEDHGAVVDALAPTLALPAPDGNAGPTLAAVVAATLAGADPDTEAGAWLAAADRLEDEGLLDLTWQESERSQITDRRPPEVLLLVSGGLDVLVEEPDDADGLAILQVRTDLVQALAELDTPLVVGAAGTEDDVDRVDGGLDALLGAVRGESGLADGVSTVDNIESASGVVASTLGLAWELQDEAGHYGLGDEAQAAVPAPPPQRLVTSPAIEEDEVPTEPVPDDAASTEPVPDDAATTTSP